MYIFLLHAGLSIGMHNTKDDNVNNAK